MPDIPHPEPAAASAHEVNFFKPVTDHARANMRLISLLVVIWAVAVFGFQLLLIHLQKPTPEPNHARFMEVWPAIQDGTASAEQRKVYARVALSVLGKNIVVKNPHKEVLRKAVADTVLDLLGADERPAYTVRLQQAHAAAASADQLLAKAAKMEAKEEAEKAREEAAAFQEEARKALGEALPAAIAAVGLEETGFDRLLRDFLSLSLARSVAEGGGEATGVPAIMNLYLVHNRSALTDTQFLGFPFHYWYTAQFLLIMFVLLCLIYAVLIDRINSRYGFQEE